MARKRDRVDRWTRRGPSVKVQFEREQIEAGVKPSAREIAAQAQFARLEAEAAQR